MSIRDSKERFGAISIFNHWTLVAVVLGLLITGLLLAEVLPESARPYLIPLHKQVGIVAAVLLVWMVIWRWMQATRPGPIAGTSAPEALARAGMHLLLLVGAAVLAVSGVMMSVLSGHEVNVLGLFTIPAIGDDPAQAALPHMVHEYVGWAMVIAVGLHAAVGVKHHVLNKDETLTRMLGRGA
ncbi:cytochrome b [Roseospira marina]|nr:cytochrome b/b6 domain-containing protein [Roseospira marina]MBB4314991.1 cytochrome b561 [Roseospira marina]MBB5087991.1 cytochrome b561 [Roseospira marina]